MARRRTNHRDTTVVATTGPVAASPRARPSAYTRKNCQRLPTSPVAAAAAASTKVPAIATLRAPTRSAIHPTTGMQAP